ncbi:serine-rich adhesin for platelets-like [Haliotis asinina]|uniref:serine-rich adhesin for platelets-like n=1 Tax=Haliotis asinina TaxID=109174 RepID=UPI00353237DA
MVINMYIACFLLTFTGSCWSQMAPPPGQVASTGIGVAGGMVGAAGMSGAGMVGGASGVGGIPTHLLGEPGENPFALDGICWNLEKQVRASLPPNASPKEKMADKIQMAITSYLNGGGEIPSTGGGNIACVIRDAKKKAGKVKVMNADLATAVADKVADAGCRIPCFDATTGTWAQPPPGMAPPSLAPALGEPMTALPLDPMSASRTYPAMGAAGPYLNNMAGPGPYDLIRSRRPYNPGMSGMVGMGPGPNEPLRGAGPYDPSMRPAGPYDPNMGTSSQYDPSMGGPGPYDPGMRASGPYDPSMGGPGPYDPSMGGPGPYDPSMGGPGPYDPNMGGPGPYDPSMGGPGPYDPSLGGPGPYDPSMGPYDRNSGVGPGAYDPTMTGSGRYDPPLGGPGPFEPGFNGAGTFDQGFGGHGPNPGQGGMGPYPADAGTRSTSLQDSLQGRHLSNQMALHERRRMGPTQLRSQMDMGNGFQDHPLSRNRPNPNTLTEHSPRQLNPPVSGTQTGGSFGQQTGSSNTDQSGGLSNRFTVSAQSVLDTGANSLSQGTSSFSSTNTAVTNRVGSPNSQAEGPTQSSQNLASDGTLKSSLVNSQALSGSVSGTNAIQAFDGMADSSGGALGQAQSMLSQSATQQQTLNHQLASDQSGVTFNRKPSTNQMTQSKMSSGMSHQRGGMSQDLANVRLQNARQDFGDQRMMSTGRMSQTSRDSSFLSDHPRSSVSHPSDMMTRPNWRMSARSSAHFNAHDMGREATMSRSSRFLQNRDRHQQLRSGSSFGHNSRMMSWNSPRSSGRMSSFSHQSTSPSFTKSIMGQRSQFDTMRLGMQSSMKSQFNGKRRFLSAAVGSTTKTFSKRPSVNSVHETPGVAETGKNGDTFSMTSTDGLGGVGSSDTTLRKKEAFSSPDTRQSPKFDAVERNSLMRGTALTEKDIFLSKGKPHLNPGTKVGTRVANEVLSSPSIERGAEGLPSVSQQVSHDGISVKDRTLEGNGGNNNIQTLRNGAEMRLSHNALPPDSNTLTTPGGDRRTDPNSRTDIQTDSFALRNTLTDVGQTGEMALGNAAANDPPPIEVPVVSAGMLTGHISSHVNGDVENKAQGLDSGAGPTLSSGGKGGATIVDGGKLTNTELATRFRPPVIIRKADINSPVRDPEIDKYGGRLRITQSIGTNDKVMEKGTVRGGDLRLGHGLPSSQTADIEARKDVMSSRNSHGIDHARDTVVNDVTYLRSKSKGQGNLHERHLAVDQRLGRAGHSQSPRSNRSFNGVVDAGLGRDVTVMGSSLGTRHRPGDHGSTVAGHRGTGPVDALPTRHGANLDTRTGHPMGARHAANRFRNEGPFPGDGMGVAAGVGFGNQSPDMGLSGSAASADMGFGNTGLYARSDVGMGSSMSVGSATDLGFGHIDHIHRPDFGLGGGQGVSGGYVMDGSPWMDGGHGMGGGHVMDGSSGMGGGHVMDGSSGMGGGHVMDGSPGMGGGRVMDGSTGMGGGHGMGMGMGLDSHLSTHTDPNAMGPDPFLLSLI